MIGRIVKVTQNVEGAPLKAVHFSIARRHKPYILLPSAAGSVDR